MKVQANNGKWYTRDHPHEILSPHVMRYETIRYWLKELSTNPGYGWVRGGIRGLHRALGMNSYFSIERKLTTGWIWPKEQVRLTARITDILDGYIVPTRFGRRVEGVWTDPPQPPKIVTPRSVSLSISRDATIRIVPTDLKPKARLPSFADVFKHVSTWDPDKR